MDTNPITLIVGTGAAVLIARTFYESFTTARGHSSAILTKDSKTKRPSKKPSATSSKESNIREVETKSKRSRRSSSAIENNGSGSSKEFADTLSLVDQKLDELANKADAEEMVSRAASPAVSVKLSQEQTVKLLEERNHVDEEAAGKNMELESSNETADDHSSDGLAIEKTSDAVQEADDFIQLHACSHLPDDSTQQSQSGVHVSVDIVKKPESGVHVSVDVMQMADGGRLTERVEHLSQDLVKQLEGSAHLSERVEHVSDKGMLHLESAVYVRDQSKLVQGNAIQQAESDVGEPAEIGHEYLAQQSERDSRSPERLPLSERENDRGARRSSRSSERSQFSEHVNRGAVRSSSRSSERSPVSDRENQNAMHRPESSAPVSEYSPRVDHAFDNVMAPPESSPRVPDMSAQSENARVSERYAQFVEEHDDAVRLPGIENEDVTGYSAADNVQTDEESEPHNKIKMTSSEIDQEIRRSIAVESLKNERLGSIVDEIRMRPDTPASPIDPQHIFAAVETLCAVYNAQQKYNKEAKNYLMQIKMEKDAMVANGYEEATNRSGTPIQEVFFNSFTRDNVEEDNTAQIIETMNDYLVSDDQNEDVDSNLADSESNSSEDEAEEEAQEARVDEVVNAEGESNTTTNSLTNSLVIYVKERGENDDSKSEGLEDEGFDVVSCVPNIFQNVIVRRILRD